MTNPPFAQGSPADQPAGPPPPARPPYDPQTRLTTPHPPPPAQKKGGAGKIIAGVAACAVLGVMVLVGLTVIAALSADPDTATPTDRVPAPAGGGEPVPEPDTAGPGTSALEPAPIGTEITAAKGWSIRVNSAELNADQRLAAESSVNTPDAGKQYVAVNVTVRNDSTEPTALFAAMDPGIVTSSGVKIRWEMVVGGPPTFQPDKALDPMGQQLQPGGTATGDLYFQVPASEVASAVLLAEPTFTLDKSKDQRFLAIQ